MKPIQLPIIILLFFAACDNEYEPKLAPPEERVAAVIRDLNEKLIAQSNGWTIQYQPNPSAANYLVILNFFENGTVRVRSNLIKSTGTFYDKTIQYRIDVGLATELIFENYTIFSYFFALDRTTYGGEFQLLLTSESDEQLVFTSKTDINNPTKLTLNPTTATDISSLSPEISTNLFELGKGGLSILTFFSSWRQMPSTQRVILPEKNHSIFWHMQTDFQQITLSAIANGTDLDAILSTNQYSFVNKTVHYEYQDNQIIFDTPISITHDGTSYTLSSITPDATTSTGPPFCPSSTENVPVYNGTSNAGPLSMERTLLSGLGEGFKPQADSIFSIWANNVATNTSISLVTKQEYASIIPNPTNFFMSYGFENDSIPPNAVGLEFTNTMGERILVLQHMSTIERELNKLKITLLEDFYIHGEATQSEIDAVKTFNEELFAGNHIYVYTLPHRYNAYIWWFFNPCNDYEFILVGLN